MIIDSKTIVMPTSPETVKRIKDAMEEASASYVRIEGERDFLKELFTDLAKDTELPKAYLVKAARLFHRQNIAEVQADQEAVTELYEQIFGTTGE